MLSLIIRVCLIRTIYVRLAKFQYHVTYRCHVTSASVRISIISHYHLSDYEYQPHRPPSTIFPCPTMPPKRKRADWGMPSRGRGHKVRRGEPQPKRPSWTLTTMPPSPEQDVDHVRRSEPSRRDSHSPSPVNSERGRQCTRRRFWNRLRRVSLLI